MSGDFLYGLLVGASLVVLLWTWIEYTDCEDYEEGYYDDTDDGGLQ